MKPALCIAACLALTSCGTTDQWKQTGSLAARKLGPVIAKMVMNSAVQMLSGGEQADFLDSAAAGLRTVAGDINDQDVKEIVTIWTTPKKEATPPEMKKVANLVAAEKAKTDISPEALASALNDAAKIVRVESRP